MSEMGIVNSCMDISGRNISRTSDGGRRAVNPAEASAVELYISDVRDITPEILTVESESFALQQTAQNNSTIVAIRIMSSLQEYM